MIFIVGPTSSGKTKLAIEAINACKGKKLCIISADSRQIYRDMNIGTGKMPLGLDQSEIYLGNDFWEISGVKIYGYDIVKPDKIFSAYEYLKYFNETMLSLRDQNIEPIVVGGTGFYIDLILGRKNTHVVEPNWALRSDLEKKSTDELAEELYSLDIEKHNRVDLNNKRRLIRAIETSYPGVTRQSSTRL